MFYRYAVSDSSLRKTERKVKFGIARDRLKMARKYEIQNEMAIDSGSMTSDLRDSGSGTQIYLFASGNSSGTPWLETSKFESGARCKMCGLYRTHTATKFP